jgi:hypothetical protein
MRHHASLCRLPQVERLEARDNPGNVFAGLVGFAEVATYYTAGAVASVFAHHSTPKPSATYSRKFLLAHGVVLPPTPNARVAYSREFLLAHGVVVSYRPAVHGMHRIALQSTALLDTHSTALQPTTAPLQTVPQEIHTMNLQPRTTLQHMHV